MALKDMVFSPSIFNHNPIDEEMVSGSEPTPEQDQRSTAISGAISNQVADAVHDQVADAVREQVRDQHSQAISAAISTQVADAVHTQIRDQQERAREHERQLGSEDISAEEARRDVVFHVAEGERVHVTKRDVPPSALPSRPPGSGIFGPEIPSALLSALQSKVECRFSSTLPDQG